VYVLPVEYAKLEARMVPQETRTHPKFGGFYLQVKTLDLNQHFTLIETGFKAQN